MSEAELAQGFGFNLTAASVLAVPQSVAGDNQSLAQGLVDKRSQCTSAMTDTYAEGEAPESTAESRYATSEFITDSGGGSQKLCGKPRRMGVRQGKRGAAGEHGCSLAASKSLSGKAGESSATQAHVKRVVSDNDTSPAQNIQPDELHRDPFFSSKHKLKEIWRGRRPSYWLDMCGRRH